VSAQIGTKIRGRHKTFGAAGVLGEETNGTYGTHGTYATHNPMCPIGTIRGYTSSKEQDDA